ncbi:hypothetical protein O3G_MSEX003491 [Manduca sexta]|uniref:G-protein coupled receptors family 1 profile domain-containing protein n=2 Tax=Manduca sexta TaxID=7130 RepID=A0A921YSD9_MANSE|nr:hypothetical protein O3G_MSEX003491 [Manduca sexta]
MPVSAVVLLSGEWDTIPVCKGLQFLTETSTYCYSLFFTLVAAETYYRLCRTTTEYEMFLSLHVGVVSCLVVFFSAIISAVGVFMKLDYDYCERHYTGSFLFRATTLGLLHALPFFMTMYGLFSSAFCISRRARIQNHYRRSQQYDRDCSTTNLNIVAYLLYVVAWIPYLVVVHEYSDSSDSRYYHAVWIGMMRSVTTSLLYSGINSNFRRAFAHLFYYCCCKSSLTDTFASRHRRALEYKPATGDVRVHIMHQAVSMCSPQRTSYATRETQEL